MKNESETVTVNDTIATPIRYWLLSSATTHNAHPVLRGRLKADVLEIARHNFQYLDRTAQQSVGGGTI